MLFKDLGWNEKKKKNRFNLKCLEKYQNVSEVSLKLIRTTGEAKRHTHWLFQKRDTAEEKALYIEYELVSTEIRTGLDRTHWESDQSHCVKRWWKYLYKDNKRRKKTETVHIFFFPIDMHRIKILHIYFSTFACNLVFVYIL